jgi:hypothetical protein
MSEAAYSSRWNSRLALRQASGSDSWASGAQCQRLELGANREQLVELLLVERVDEYPSLAVEGHQTLGLQATKRLAYGDDADVEALRQGLQMDHPRAVDAF